MPNARITASTLYQVAPSATYASHPASTPGRHSLMVSFMAGGECEVGGQSRGRGTPRAPFWRMTTYLAGGAWQLIWVDEFSLLLCDGA